MAAQIFKVKEADVTKAQRGMAKTVNFGVLYGMSAVGLVDAAGDPAEGGGAVHRRVLRPLPEGAGLPAAAAGERSQDGGRAARSWAASGGSTRPRSTRTRSYRNRGQAEREAINMEIQGSAADLIKLAMLAVYATGCGAEAASARCC